MPELPVMLKIEGRKCVVIGGGAVAARRIQSLLDCGARVTVIAPDVCPETRRLAEMGVTWLQRPYESGDLEGALLAVIATDQPAANQAISEEAAALGVLANRADTPDAGEVSVPAHAHHGPVTLAVHTGGISASAAAVIRRELSGSLDPDWPRLLEAVAPFRALLQARLPDAAQRQAALRQLADAEALSLLKAKGEAAVIARCERLATSG